MSDDRPRTGPYAVVERIQQATSSRDLEALVGCFTSDYDSVWPIHPARTFTGSEQVRRNWGQIFDTVPDLKTQIIDFAVAGEDVWVEWEFAGNRLDGQPFLMRGVTVLHVQGDQATQARFFLEPVEADADEVNAAIRELLTGSVAHPERAEP